MKKKIVSLFLLIMMFNCITVYGNTIKKPVIVAYGDSITQCIHTKEEDMWTTLLQNKLYATIVNSGVAGQTTRDALKRIDKDVLEKNPDYVLINFGMNDHCYVSEGISYISIKEYKDNLNEMVKKIKGIGATPIIVTPHRVIEGNVGDGNMSGDASYYYKRHPYTWYKNVDGANNQLLRYVNAAKEVATENEIHVIDIYEKSKDVDLNTVLRTIENSNDDDGVHLSKDGMKFYADNISKELKNIMKE